ncbi:hypothetical protein PT310_03405, partial [Metamycoplasma hyosynoviae]|uniref:hypothetical protein n=1 Tax=Metamycoplasma hyosynoviae TaxID=29559 RepID=UPI00235EE075
SSILLKNKLLNIKNYFERKIEHINVKFKNIMQRDYGSKQNDVLLEMFLYPIDKRCHRKSCFYLLVLILMKLKKI